MKRQIIIDRPTLRSPGMRTRDAVLTFLMWGVYFYLWLPLISLAGWWFGFKLFYDEMIIRGGYDGLTRVIGWWGLTIVLIVSTVLLWSYSNRIRFRGHERRQNSAPVSDEVTAEYFNVTEADFARLKTAHRAVLVWDEAGQLTEIDTGHRSDPIRKFPGRRNRPTPEVPAAESSDPISVSES